MFSKRTAWLPSLCLCLLSMTACHSVPDKKATIIDSPATDSSIVNDTVPPVPLDVKEFTIRDLKKIDSPNRLEKIRPKKKTSKLHHTKANDFFAFADIYNSNNLTDQSFTINASKDTILIGSAGTKIRIAANSFTLNGAPFTGIMQIRLKEALSAEQIVLANLITTYQNKPLETGGMIFLDAHADGKKLLLSPKHAVDIAVPADSLLNNMMLFEGEGTRDLVEWANPVPIQENQLTGNYFSYTYTVSYPYLALIPASLNEKVIEIVDQDRSKIVKGYSFAIGDTIIDILASSDSVVRGWNNFATDNNTSYVFTLKKLGWANIDRLLNDPRTRPVDFATKVENQADFKNLYITLVTQNMYLPGYLKKDLSYGFSHGDDEPQQLPVAEKATIIATAYKDGKTYFSMKQIIIEQKLSVSLSLEETTVEQLKAKVMEAL